MSQALQNFTEELNSALAPLVPNSYLTIAYSDNLHPSTTLRFSVEPKEQWSGGIWHNSTNLLAFIYERRGAYELEVSQFSRQGFGKLGVKLLTKKSGTGEAVKAHLAKFFTAVEKAKNGEATPVAAPKTATGRELEAAARMLREAPDARSANAALKLCGKMLGIANPRVRIINSYNWPSCNMELIADTPIPNRLRQLVLIGQYGPDVAEAKSDNVYWGNIQPNRVCIMRAEKWAEAINAYAAELQTPVTNP